MRLLLSAGVSLLALASTPLLASQAFAQATENSGAPTQSTPDPNSPGAVTDEAPAEQPVGGMIDTVIDQNQDTALAAAPAPTGDPVLDRLNTLESRIAQLERRNAELEQRAEADEARLQSTETRAAKDVQFSWGPTLSDTGGNFTFKPRGVIDADYVGFSERKGGYDYNSGTGFRRARIGLEGTAFKKFNWRIEVDFAGNVVAVQDAYLQYIASAKWLITAGQFKAPFGLESNNSDNYNTFIERGMFTNAFGNAGAERRLGASVTYATDTFNVSAGAFGDNESVIRSATAPVTNTPGESWGYNGRATWEPLFQPDRIIHLGISGFWRNNLRSGDTDDALRLSDRPNIRVDNGNIADGGVITGVNSIYYVGGEGAAVFGPVTLAGEYGKLWANRQKLPNASFDGFYVYGSWFITGEFRSFKNGNFDRVRPFNNFGDGHLGALELAVRYDRIDLSDTPVVARAGNKANSWTAALNWYLNPYAKLMFNWVRFSGNNTPLDPIGSKTEGDAFATRLHYDF